MTRWLSDRVEELERDVGRIDANCKLLDKRDDAQHKRINDLYGRINRLEGELRDHVKAIVVLYFLCVVLAVFVVHLLVSG
jgi:hypothetical protein